MLVTPPELDKKILEDVCSREGVESEIWPLHKAIAELGTLLLSPAPKPDSDIVAALKSYVSTGGGLVVPNGGSLTSSLLDIPEYGAQKLNSLRSSYQAPGPAIPSEARCLVAHPVVNGFPCGGWLSAKTLAGVVPPLPRKPKTGLPLMLFRNPAGTGVQVHPFGYGGIVELSWDVYAGGQLGNRDAKEVLRNVLQWLLARANWKRPLEEPILSVEGKVLATDDSPVPKAAVTGKVFADWGEPVREVTTVSAEDGSFTLAGYAPSIYAFEVSAEGYFQEDRFVMARCEVGREDGPTVILMRRTVALYGTVHYGEETGALAPDFPVRLLPADRDVHSQAQETRTDDKGEFAFKTVEHGRTVLLIAEKDDWVGMKTVELSLGQHEEPARVELAVFQAPEVRGKVIDGDTETPLPQAKVKVEPHYPKAKIRVFENHLRRVVETDDQANFVLRLSPGRWRLEPKAKGYITWDRTIETEDDIKYLSGLAEITLSESSPKDEIVLKLEEFPLVRFYGTVYFPSAEPAAGARVVVDALPGASQGVYMTDSLGRYTTDPIPRLPGFDGEDQGQKGKKLFTFWFGVRCGEFAISELVELEVLDKEVKRDFWLGEGISISGFVRDPRGNPVQGANVFPVKLYTRAREGQETLSAADGSFTLQGFSRTIWPSKLRAEKTVRTDSGDVLYAGEVVPRFAFRDEPVEGIEIIIARAGDISGRLLYYDGSPVRNAEVSFTMFYTTGRPWSQPGLGTRGPTTTLLNDRGEFHIRTPCVYQMQSIIWRDRGRDGWREPETIPSDAGKWDILLSCDRTSEAGSISAQSIVFIKGVEAGTSNLEIRLPPLGRVVGRVFDADTASAMRDFQIGMVVQDESLPEKNRGVTYVENVSNDTGEFQIGGLVPGAYTLSISKKDCHSFHAADLLIRGGERVDLGEIALGRSWTVYGKVIEERTRQPVKGEVKAGSSTMRIWEDGFFMFGLSPMHGVKVRIVPDDPDLEELNLQVEYRGEARTDLGEIILRPREAPKKE